MKKSNCHICQKKVLESTLKICFVLKRHRRGGGFLVPLCPKCHKDRMLEDDFYELCYGKKVRK